MNGKATKIVCIVMAVVMAAAGIVFAVSLKKGGGSAEGETQKAPEPVVFSFDSSAYSTSGALSVKGANGEVYLPTDFENVYHTASLDGKVSFFEYAGGEMKPCALEVKQVKANIKASRETIPVTVNYIEKDGKACGYGVFTSDMSKDVEVYAYAFVKLTAKPAGYGNGYLLLADFDKNGFYRADKLFSEIYEFNISNGKTSRKVSNNTRLIDSNGTFRQDWTLLTDDFMKNLGNEKYFLSSRYYNESDKGNRADIMVYSDAYRPQIIVKDILGLWFVNDANGMHYLKKTDNGFANMLKTGDKETALTQFEGDWLTDYLQCGKYLINKKTLVMFDLLTGASKALSGINIEAADEVSVSPDGTKAVFACYGELNANGTPVQSLVYCTVDGSAEPAVYTEPMLFSESAGFVWLDNSSVMSVRALGADGAKAGSVAYTF